MDLVKVGENIKKYREEMDVTQVELGKMIGVSNQVISNWERGKDKAVRLVVLNKIAEALGIDKGHYCGTGIRRKKMNEAIKKDARESAKNQDNYNPYYMTMQIKNFNDPFYQRQLERKIRRSKMIRRRELIKRAIRYTIGFGTLALLWIFATGIAG